MRNGKKRKGQEGEGEETRERERERERGGIAAISREHSKLFESLFSPNGQRILSSASSSSSLQLRILLIKQRYKNAVVNQGSPSRAYFVVDETFFDPVNTATKFKVLR